VIFQQAFPTITEHPVLSAQKQISVSSHNFPTINTDFSYTNFFYGKITISLTKPENIEHSLQIDLPQCVEAFLIHALKLAQIAK